MIYDCFPFFNELDTIEIRFKELYNVVDFFVISESRLTHSGKSKPLYFSDNKKRFAPFQDKIINLVCNEPPQSSDMNWGREKNQRNHIYNHLKTRCKPDDIIISSDADEIFNSNKIDELKSVNHDDLYALVMEPSWYYLNLVSDPRWTSGRAVRFGVLENKFNGNLSNARTSGVHKSIENAGWHFAYMGGTNRVKEKLESFAHQELNRPEITNHDHVKDIIRLGTSPWDKFDEITPRGCVPYWKHVRVEDSNFPDCIKRGEYNHMLSNTFFSQYLYDCGNLYHLRLLTKQCVGVGEIIDIGCFEGRTSIFLANALPDKCVQCVDVRFTEQFSKNMKSLTNSNYTFIEKDALEFIKDFDKPISVLHVDANYEYSFLKKLLELSKPKMTSSFLVCGYDWSVDTVRQAVNEVWGEPATSGKFWFCKL
jgi:hypothetical protein